MIVGLGKGDGRRIDIHADDDLVRIQFSQPVATVSAAAGHIQHTCADEPRGGEIVALHMDTQGFAIIMILCVELLRVDAFDGGRGSRHGRSS